MTQAAPQQRRPADSASIGPAAPASQVKDLPPDRADMLYRWPPEDAFDAQAWQVSTDQRWLTRSLPESEAELAVDSRWPALFPSAMCLVTASDGKTAVLEKVVGASIVNRFPYVLALSFCRQPLSERHYQRSTFMHIAESAGRVAVQFVMPGAELRRALEAIATVPEDCMAERLAKASDTYRSALRSPAPVLDSAYLVYEGRLVRPGHGISGEPINPLPWTDCGSHRIYYFEIETISLREDIATGRAPLHWRSLPSWRGLASDGSLTDLESVRARRESIACMGYTKLYRPDYTFPSADTVAFPGTPADDGFWVLDLPPLAENQVEIDNDRARWPCFFPSSLGIITVETPDGTRGAFPCGSTAMVARNPLTVGIAVCYANVNVRYAPRASLDLIRTAGRFGCGVPIYRQDVIEAIGYLGNISLRNDPDKVRHSGFSPVTLGNSFGFAELPVHFDCRVVEEIRLGTHSLFLGQVERVFVRRGVTSASPLEWCPWAGQQPVA